MLRSAAHLILHVAAPGAVARLFGGDGWIKAWLIMVATMVVDLDHLLADPIYDPNRCSLTSHPLHSPPAIICYAVLTNFPKTRWVGWGLLIHMALDGIDCFLMG